MENFVVSARKYRPTTFDSVVGQKAITNTLKNAIKTQHLAQAFLFCGSRGVGKTTCARILAKTINCFNRTSAVEACNECDSCTSFNEGASLNIHELDGASNNSVDDIRALIDQVRFAPQIGSHKVYIVDEVHMLTTSAFNAFLKTLEEPPAHAIFILATTEKHKIIPTILSRCQIFDFNRIEVEDIALHLGSIAEKEGISAEEEALHLVAQKADGALRDALSIFDQLVSFAGNNLTYEATLQSLNILDYDYYFKAVDYLLNENIPQSLLLLNEVINNGFDGHLFITGLAAHCRNLLVCLDPQTVQLLEVGKKVKAKYLEQSKVCSMQFLLEAIEICRQCDTQYRASKNKRLLVELTLMQIASISSAATLGSASKKKALIKSPEESKQNPSTEPVVTSRAEVSEEVKEPEQQIEPEPQLSIVAEPPPKELSKPEKSNTEEKKSKFSNKFAKLGSQASKTSELSISALTKEEEATAEKNTQVYSSDAREEYTSDDFKKVWVSLAEKIRDEGKEGSSMVYSAMTVKEPQLLEGFKVELAVDNKSQQEELMDLRTDMHEFLRKQLKNGGIELQFKVEKDSKQKKAYFAPEKFERMAKENPHLLTLKKELGLDFI